MVTVRLGMSVRVVRVSTGGLARVRFFDEGQHVLGRGRLPQEATELVLSEVGEDRTHRIDVFLEPRFRADQKEDRVHGLLVHRLEVDPFLAVSDRDAEVHHVGRLDVGHRDAVTEAGRASMEGCEPFILSIAF